MSVTDQSNKRGNVLGLYMEGIRDGNPKAAIRKYSGARYTQHSTGVPDQQEGFVEFFEAFIERNPKREMTVLRTIEDGDHVFCHVMQSLNDGAARWVTMDIFETDDADRVIEHWDVIEAYSERTASGEDMVAAVIESSEVEPAGVEITRANKTLAREYVKRVLTAQLFDQLGDFVAEDVVQHVPHVDSGLAALRTALESGVVGRTEMLFLLVGEGSLVATLSKVVQRSEEHCVCDLYRIVGGRIAEHWATDEPIPPRREWRNSGKF